MKENTAWKVSKYGVISGPNTGKYGTETIISNSLHNEAGIYYLTI